jgi:hypothetical protein
MGWPPGELFDRPVGLVWWLAGDGVDAMSEDIARVSNRRLFLRHSARPFPEGNRLWDKTGDKTGDKTRL